MTLCKRGSPSRYFDTRTGLLLLDMLRCHGSGRGARPGAERSCRPMTNKQTRRFGRPAGAIQVARR